jgi:hypothetical protein
MRPWAGPIGFLGATASLIFWIVVPSVATGHNLYMHAGNELFYAVFAILSGVGIVGAVMVARGTRLAPLLLALAIIPGVGALFVPGLMLVIATLLALEKPQPARPT